MNPLQRIEDKMPQFTKTEIKIANCILDDPKTFALNPIDQIVKTSKTSKPAMIRFAKKLGYNGYSQFKFDLARHIVSNNIDPQYEEVKYNDNYVEAISDTLQEFCKTLSSKISLAQIETIAQHIKKANKVKLFASNKSYITAQLLRINAYKLGIDIDCVTESSNMIDCIDCLDENDLIIIYTIKDQNEIFGSVLQRCQQRHIPSAIITQTPTLPFVTLTTYLVSLPSLDGTKLFHDDQLVFAIYNEMLLYALGK